MEFKFVPSGPVTLAFCT